ncbi:hypothetical protein J3459_010145 [Metarhizium acridum]|nr:hypothetical protein J3459_010145 [Metarhizium acridum]
MHSAYFRKNGGLEETNNSSTKQPTIAPSLWRAGLGPLALASSAPGRDATSGLLVTSHFRHNQNSVGSCPWKHVSRQLLDHPQVNRLTEYYWSADLLCNFVFDWMLRGQIVSWRANGLLNRGILTMDTPHHPSKSIGTYFSGL